MNTGCQQKGGTSRSGSIIIVAIMFAILARFLEPVVHTHVKFPPSLLLCQLSYNRRDLGISSPSVSCKGFPSPSPLQDNVYHERLRPRCEVNDFCEPSGEALRFCPLYLVVCQSTGSRMETPKQSGDQHISLPSIVSANVLCPDKKWVTAAYPSFSLSRSRCFAVSVPPWPCPLVWLLFMF